MRTTATTWLLGLAILLSLFSLALTQTCGDGVRAGSEDCDDGDNITGDGCSNACMVEDNFMCSEDIYGMSICEAVLLDLNVPDTTTLNYIDEYLDLNEIVWLFDPNSTNFSSFFVSDLGGNWTYIYAIILNGVDPIDNTIDVFPQEALDASRVSIGPSDLRLVRRQLFTGDSRAEGFGIDTSEIVTGMIISGESSSSVGGGDEVLGSVEIEFVLRTVGFIAREHPGYSPRDVCLVGQDSMYNTTACVTLYFIGRNDDEPEISYIPDSTAAFIEGQLEFEHIVDGVLTVTDQDHPTRYLMMSAQAAIVDFVSGYPEQVSVTGQHPDFSYDFNSTTGILTISGNGTTDVYSDILSNLTYHNNMTEPLGDSRTIRVTIFDGIFTSDPLDITVQIINVNDAPVISLDGASPVVTNATSSYTEASGARRVLPRGVVIDTDPSAMIQRLTVTLTNPVDSGFEFIDFTANLTGTGVTLTGTSYSVEVTGLGTPDLYTTVLRSLTYLHSDAEPGNPTPMPARILEFEAEDETGVQNEVTSTLHLSILPVNDPPILLFVSDPVLRSGPLVLKGQTESTFMYLEDDPALIIGSDIYIRDVDSNISSVTLQATGLVNGAQDRLFFPSLYGLDINEVELGGGNRTITLTGDFSPAHYERVLQTLSYQSTFMNNSVTDGRRTISITAIDTAGDQSNYIRAHVDVMDRNDGPQIDIGPGVNMDHMITLTENGDSIPITQTFLTSLGDEEGHNISRLTVQLVALNGQLDAQEFIFFRTPSGIDFLDHIEDPLTTTFISISVNSSVELYEQALRSIFYLNAQEEPTIYNSSTGNDRLMRAITIQITDTNYVSPTADPAVTADADMGVSTTTIRIGIELKSINDNGPSILLRTDPESCSTDSLDYDEAVIDVARRRRDVRSVSRIRKRSVTLNSAKDFIYSMVLSAVPNFTDSNSPSTKCLKQVTVTFNTDTNAPLVEIPSRIGDLISFDPPSLNSAEKFGIWLDYQTLVVTFLDCAEVEVETTSGKMRPMFIVFEAEQDDCTWDTDCTKGICFYNNTGCPMITYTPITTPKPPSQTTTPVGDSTTSKNDLKSYLLVVLFEVFIAATLVFGALLIVVACTSMFRRKKRSLSNKSSPSSTIESPYSDKHSHVQDLVIVTLDSKPEPKSSSTVDDNSTEKKLPSSKNKKSSSECESTLSENSPKTEKPIETSKISGSSTSKKQPPGKRGESREMPKAKRKRDNPSQKIEESTPNERVQEVQKSCDQSHDQTSPDIRGNESAVSSREQSIDCSHRDQSTTQSNRTPNSKV